MGCQGSLSEEESQTTAVGSESSAQDDKDMFFFCFPVKFQRKNQLRYEQVSTSIPLEVDAVAVDIFAATIVQAYFTSRCFRMFS